MEGETIACQSLNVSPVSTFYPYDFDFCGRFHLRTLMLLEWSVLSVGLSIINLNYLLQVNRHNRALI